MGTALAVVGVPLVVILVIAAAALAWRKRTPEERYWHDVSHLRGRSRTRRVRGDDAVGSVWAAGFLPVNFLHLGDGGDDDSDDDSGDDSGGGGCGGGGCGGGGCGGGGD